MIIQPADSIYRVTQSSNLADIASHVSDTPDEKQSKKLLRKEVTAIASLQRKLYAQNRFALLLVFQAIDAAGKDSTIRNVTKGINPAGFQVYSFKQPSSEELDHDFMWRTSKALPEKGRIGIFNRSYYEEVLVVRVHPEYLGSQGIHINADDEQALQNLWQSRFQSITQHEAHLANNNTVVVKFWLNVSKAEQKRRFLSRIDTPEKNWKFSDSDLKERAHWDKYVTAYHDMIKATTQDYAPWFVIPADNKPYMRLCVAEIIHETLRNIDPQYPQVSETDKQELALCKQKLEQETD